MARSHEYDRGEPSRAGKFPSTTQRGWFEKRYTAVAGFHDSLPVASSVGGINERKSV